MREIIKVAAYKKDEKRCKRRNYDLEKLFEAISLLANDETLPTKYVDHKMQGNFVDCRNCHIEPDWILIYRLEEERLHLIRTGTHSDLF